MKKRLAVFLAGIFLCLGSALAQTKVSGVVIGAADNEPVIGATVTVVGTKIATVTVAPITGSLSAAPITTPETFV